jgi:D-glycero-alpha-D-manno-heptose 1-phosphate guanylyltransferase
MEVIILAGGIGSRLQSVVADVPKPMADVAGRPFLEYLLEHAARHGVTRAILAVGYKYEVIQQHFGAKFHGVEIAYSIERERLGTGGCIRLALPLVRTDNFFVLNGDSFFAAPLNQLMTAHMSNGWDMSVALKPMPEAGRYGTVETDQAHRIIAWREKSATRPGDINAGVYAVKKTFIESLNMPASFSLERDVMEPKAMQYQFGGVRFDSYFIDIGIPEDYARAQVELPGQV